MSTIRHVHFTREVGKNRIAYRWYAKGIAWDFILHPDRKLFRKGVEFAQVGGVKEILCIDDAVLFSLGFEEGTLAECDRGDA